MENNTVRVTKVETLKAIIKYLETGETTTFPAKLDKDGNVVKQSVTMDIPTMVARLNAEIVLLEKKNSGEKKLTENQKNNQKLGEKVIEYLAGLDISDEKPGASCAEMVKNIPEFADYTVSKVSAILRLPEVAEQIGSVTKKGKKFFFLA